MSENSYIEGIFAKARRHDKTIVLPEGEDERVLKAAHLIRKQQIAKLVILGDVESINAHFAKQGWDLDGITLIDPAKSDRLGAYAELLYNLRKEKGLSREDAAKLALNANYFGTLMIKSGDADGMVSGANHSTADTVRPALQIIKSAHKDRGVSSMLSWSATISLTTFPIVPSTLIQAPKNWQTSPWKAQKASCSSVTRRISPCCPIRLTAQAKAKA